MARKKYIPPVVMVESLEVDMNYALGCGSSINSSTVACMFKSAPNEFEDLVYGWGLNPDTPLQSSEYSEIVFSSSQSCSASCYQGPYDTFFSS